MTDFRDVFEEQLIEASRRVDGRPVVHGSHVPYSCTTACVTVNARASATSSIICSMSELRNSIDWLQDLQIRWKWRGCR